MTIDTTLTAKLRASVRTLGAALGACMADPHTDKCRSLWLCEQHRALLAMPADKGEAGEAMMLPDPAKLWALAEWLDVKYPNDPKPEVQDDLRTWARAIYATDPVTYAKFKQKEVIEATDQQQPAATTPSAPDEHVMVYCARCGEVSAADDEVEDDVCPRCAAPGCLSGRFTGFPPLGASEAVERYLMARAADQQQPGDGRGTRNNAVEPSVEETQANHE